ncbi:MAG: hypothetical protein ACE141_14750 [Bryobacteraceae bacterium]
MFTWICPQCGLEVPPSSSECPECARRAAGKPAGEAPASGPPRQEQTEAVKVPAAPKPRRTSATPAWALVLVVAIAFLSMGTLGFVAYRYLAHRGEPLTPGPLIPRRSPPPADTANSATMTAHVLNKYIEVTGLRLLEENPKNLQVEFVIVNHSPAPLTDVAGTVTIRPITAKSDGESVGTFNFRLPELRPFEAKNMRAPLQSKLRVYELPDWQFIRADVVITSPQPGL